MHLGSCNELKCDNSQFLNIMRYFGNFCLQCEVGSIVMLKAGGDFFYDTDDRDVTRKPLLLLAGGVGINPLLSILSEIHDKRLQTDVMLLYCCISLDECIFKVSVFCNFYI